MPRIEAPTVVEHHAMRRQQVVTAAEAVLVELGAAALTPAAVAKRAGLARSSIYQYFPSAEALLAAAVQSLLVGTRDRMARAVAGADTPGERLTTYVRAAILGAESGHGSFPDLGDVEMPDSCRAAVRALHAELTAPLAEALADAGASDPDLLVPLVMGAINGAVTAIGHGAPTGPTSDGAVAFVLRGTGLSG